MLKSLRFISSLFVILVLVFSAVLCSGYSLIAADDFQSTQSIDIGFGFDDLIKGSDIIVTGTVTEKTSYWNDEYTGILSTIVLSVEETLKGTISNNLVIITYPGGEAEGMWEWVSDSPNLNQGEQALVLLKEIPEDQTPKTQVIKNDYKEQYEIYGGSHGKYSISDKMAGNIPLSEFKQRVKNVIEGQQFSIMEQEIPADEVTFPYEYTGLCWPHPPNPNVRYYINENTPDCSNEASSVIAASLTWNAADAKFSFNYAGSTTANKYGYDGANEILWRDLNDPSVLASHISGILDLPF